MTIDKNNDGNKLVIAVAGRLDTNTAPELEASYKESITGIEDLVIDLKDLEYISSAGLRVILTMQKAMNKQGKMVITNVSPTIMEIFDITGFADILTIE